MNYKIIIIVSIFFLAIYFIILGYQENTNDYEKDYNKIVGKIIGKKIESTDVITNKKNTNKFQHIKKFRIKIIYNYEVNGKDYTGFYYNDGNNSKFLDENEYIPIGNMYNYVKYINVYHNKKNPRDSCYKLGEIKNEKRKIYYLLSVGLFFMVPFIIFY